MRRFTFNLLAVLIAAFALIQLVPIDPPENPPLETEMPLPAEVRALFLRSCYDCHSFETEWPWYSKVAPASWLIKREVDEGRAALNFSAWNRFTAQEQQELPDKIWDVVLSGKMPPAYYLLLKRDAKFSGRDMGILRAWYADNDSGRRSVSAP